MILPRQARDKHRENSQKDMLEVSEAYVEAAELGINQEGADPAQVEAAVEAQLQDAYLRASEAHAAAVEESQRLLDEKRLEARQAWLVHAKEVKEAVKAAKSYSKEQKQADKAQQKAEKADLVVAAQEEKMA
eukprot:COSAG06_NODE_5996_length_3163_cov_1.489883_1_plen_131_part_10